MLKYALFVLASVAAFGQITPIPGPSGGGGGGDVAGGTNLTTVGAVPYVSAAATLDEDGSFLRVANGQYTLYDPTAVTGVSTFTIRAGAGQSTNYLTAWKDAANTSILAVRDNGVTVFVGNETLVTRSVQYGTDRLGMFVPAAGTGSSLYTLDSAGIVRWDSATGSGTKDIGFARNAAGIVEVNDGVTPGTLRDLIQRHPLAGGTSPTITSGFGTTPSIAGKDAAGRVTVGTGGTAATGTITFGTAWATAPVCTAANETTQLALFPTASTTTLVLASTTPFTAADKLVYQCIGY